MRPADTSVDPSPMQPEAELASAGRMMLAQAYSTRAIITFFTFTFAWTWGLWGIVTLIREAAPLLGNGLYLVGAFGPSLAALIVVLMFAGPAGLGHWLGQCLQWRINWRWYALAVTAPPLILLAALGLQLALGGAIPTSPYADRFLIAFAQFVVIVILGGPLGEEFGWRGYALPAL